MSNAPETPAPINEQQTTRERVGAVAAWLVDGKLRPECVAAAMQDWQVSRRTAQVYVARAAARIVKATTFEDPHFALKLSQVQRDKLHQALQELLRTGEFIPFPHWQMKVKTIQADLKLLDSRDRTAAKLLQAESPSRMLRESAAGPVRPVLPVRPALPAHVPAPSPLLEKAGVEGQTAGTFPGTTASQLKQPPKVLRDDPPPATAKEKSKPQSAPRPNPLLPTLADVARVVLGQASAKEPRSAHAASLAAADIAIVPCQPKGKAAKEMRHSARRPAEPAPNRVSCALDTIPVVNRPHEASPPQGAG